MLRSIALTLLMSLSSSLHAQNVYTWNGATPFADWSNSTLWLGPAGYPDDTGDWAVIADTFIGPTMDVSATIGQLTLEPGAYLATSTNGLLAVSVGSGTNGLTFLQTGSLLNLNPYGPTTFREFDTDDLTNFGGELRLNDVEVHIDNELNNLENSLIVGSGEILMTADVDGFPNLMNDGTIRASGGTLTIRTQEPTNATFDFDGSAGTGRLEVLDNAILAIYARASFHRVDMTIGSNSTFELLAPSSPSMTIGIDGSLITTPLGGVSSLNSLGGSFDLACPIELGEGTTEFNCPLILREEANVVLSNNANVTFNGLTVFEAPGSFDAGSTGTMHVNDTLTIGAGTGVFNWDGSGSFNTSIGPDGFLGIDVANVEAGNTDTFNADIYLQNVLDIEVGDGEWLLDNSASIRVGPSTGQPTIRGSAIRHSGLISIDAGDLFGTTELVIESRTFFEGTVEFLIQSIGNASIRIAGGSSAEPNVIADMTVLNPDDGRFINDGVTRMFNSLGLRRMTFENNGVLTTSSVPVADRYRIINDGDLHIGNHSTVAINLSQLILEDDSVVFIEIKDPDNVTGASFDSIHIVTDITILDVLELDGELSVSLIDYQPPSGEEFVILRRDSGQPITGTFDSATLPEGFSIIYDNDRVILRYDAPCLADWNGDNEFNTADFLAYFNDYNAVRGGHSPTFGDPDLAVPFGTLNTADFLVYLNAFTTGCF